jgi:hypothetical protein
LGSSVPYGVLGPLHRPGTQLARLPSAALLGPFAPALTLQPASHFSYAPWREKLRTLRGALLDHLPPLPKA